MSKASVIADIAKDIEQRFSGESSGHDWWHIYRVWKTTQYIGRKERADMHAAELGALLHDIADWKFHDYDETVGPRRAREMLEKHHVDEPIIAHVQQIVNEIGFKGGNNPPPSTLEGKVVQDADRLDAIGAIGVARVFMYSGHTGRPMHDPNITPMLHMTKDQYANNKNTAINHFYEKLLLLKDRMNTPTGRALAEERHVFLERYLDQFYSEWDAKH